IKHLQKSCKHTLFVFDEPTIGLHPSDIQVLLKVLRRLQKKGATIVIITHDLDIMTNCDYLIDLGPKGGSNGGQVMATGNPFALVKSNNSSLT
ncbi:excinuclease ABC subunit A, partial [Veillonellaceae bacterium M2-4]|nr:excinuclease ABC subunit A [Veillonellaceae bacterium M2-4]